MTPDTPTPESLATAELTALEAIYRVLKPLTPEQRSRMVTYVCKLLEIEVDL